MFSLPIKLWSSLAILGVVGVVMFTAYMLIDNLRESAKEEGAQQVRAEVAAQDAEAQAEAQKIADEAETQAASAARMPGVHERIRKNWCTNCPEAYK